jgi:hypothetical protein
MGGERPQNRMNRPGAEAPDRLQAVKARAKCIACR